MLEVTPVPGQARARARVEFASHLGTSAKSLDLLDALVSAVLHELPQLLEGDPVSATRGHDEGVAVGVETIPPPLGSANLPSHTYLQTKEIQNWGYNENITFVGICFSTDKFYTYSPEDHPPEILVMRKISLHGGCDMRVSEQIYKKTQKTDPDTMI